MSEDSRRVLDMLAQGKINVTEAEHLLQALGEGPAARKSAPAEEAKATPEGEKRKPRFLRIEVIPIPGGGSHHKGPVNIRLPLGFLRSGIKLAGIMPDYWQGRWGERLRERGFDIDVDKMRPEDVEKLIATLGELSLDVNSDKEKVRIFCE